MISKGVPTTVSSEAAANTSLPESRAGPSIEVPSGTLDEQSSLLLEREAVRRARKKEIRDPWTGIALSGGGIRSATFCLGALQRFAKAGLLSQVDYLSSVSGGGYIASSLQWWWKRDSGSNAGNNFPYGTELRATNERLAFLRGHGSYLTPGDGITYWSGIAVVLRTVMLNLGIWFPLLVGSFLLLLAPTAILKVNHYHRLWIDSLGTEYPHLFALFIAVSAGLLILVALAAIALAWTTMLIPPEVIDTHKTKWSRAAKCALVGLILLIPSVMAFLLVRAGGQLEATYFGSSFPYGFATAVLGLFSACSLLVAALQIKRKLPSGLNYVLRRTFDTWAGDVLVWATAVALIGFIPFVSQQIFDAWNQYSKSAAAAGGLVAIGGIVSSLYGHLIQAQRAAAGPAGRWVATVAAAVFLYFLAVSAYVVAEFILFPSGTIIKIIPAAQGIWLGLTVVSVGCIIAAVVFGGFSNLNHLGMHRFYRDRLMEAFMPTVEATGKIRKFSEADGLALTEIWETRSGVPYPIINTNVILVNEAITKFQVRGGDSFILTPLLVGSSATGWEATAQHANEHGPLTLASAMAASGAAANANAGYVGSGITRDRIISALMMVLNMRLGLWIGSPVGNPGRPNHFWPGLTHGILRWGYKRTSRFIELSDGGHFDNLGLYELIRRETDLVIAIDAEEDPTTAMTALVSVCQRVREDFGAEIDIDDAADVFFGKEREGYPIQAKLSQEPYFGCKIRYRSGKEAALIYIKASFIAGLGFTVRGYRARNIDFPNQSTADQFFDAAQFEAYRELGYVSAGRLVETFDLDNNPLIQAVFNKLGIASARFGARDNTGTGQRDGTT